MNRSDWLLEQVQQRQELCDLLAIMTRNTEESISQAVATARSGPSTIRGVRRNRQEWLLDEDRQRHELRDNPRVMAKAAQGAMGDWLGSVPWDWYTTHTFKAQYVSPAAADRRFYSWFDQVRRSTAVEYPGQHPYYFRVTELQDRGTLHYHTLVGDVGDLERRGFRKLWEIFDGFARVEHYDPGRGAAAYVGKYLVKGQGDIRFSHRLDRLFHSMDISREIVVA